MGKKTDIESVHLLNHSKCMLGAFQNFRQDETMLDVTLVCNGKSLKAHKLVLASCSQFFKELFSENPCKHPIVILRHFDFEDLKACIDFIYKGELSVPRERLMSALKVAEDLNIRGLMPSGTNKEKYKQLYNQFCGKPAHRKKRKRHRHNSVESQDSNCVKLTDSDQNVDSDVDNVTFPESQVMDVESNCTEENLVNEKEVRPLVLHVGDTSNEESTSKVEEDQGELIETNLVENNLSADDIPVESSPVQIDTKEEIYDMVAENVELSSQFDTYATFSDNSNLESVPDDEQNNSQDQSMGSVSASEDLEKQSTFISHLSPNSLEGQECQEARSSEEGKRFVCSKCDSIFTSRINFMRHKALGHNNMEKTVHKCQYCTYTTHDMDCLKQHILTHTDSVPYKCGTCSEEFTSEEMYQKHASLHEAEEITLQDFPPVDEQVVFSPDNKSSAKNLEFKCSICFLQFNSKLRCEIHEETCQGGS